MDVATMANNLVALYNQVPGDVRESGVQWYHEVRGWAHSQSNQFNISPWQVAAITAALSPRMAWEKNQQAARLVMLVWAGGGDWKDVMSLPGLKRSLGNAWMVLTGQSELALRGPKTLAFADNIAFQESNEITVDVWAARAAKQDWLCKPYDVTKRYDEFAQAYRIGAQAAGLRGYEFQAVLWVWVRYAVASKVTPRQLVLL